MKSAGMGFDVIVQAGKLRLMSHNQVGTSANVYRIDT